MDFSDNQKPKRTLKDYIWVAVRGFAMGAADVVPGVSGGTMAFILGIYEELIQAISSIDIHFICNILTFRWKAAFAEFPWRFVLALVIGIATAIFSLASALNWALHNHPEFVWAFFFGLVLASAVVVRKRVRRWTPAALLLMVMFAVGGYVLVGSVPVETPNEPWFLFLSSALAINAMILPGISGAFILVLLGKYHYVLNAVVTRDFLTLLLVMAGAGVGLISFARLLRWLFKNYHDLTVAALIGLIIGALRKVWPWKEAIGSSEAELLIESNVLPAVFNADVILAVGLMVLGFFVVVMMDHMAARSAGKQRGSLGQEKTTGMPS